MKNFKASSGGTPGVVLPEGTRIWYLKDIEDVEIKQKKWRKVAGGKSVMDGYTGEMEDAKRFKFATTDKVLGNAYTRVETRNVVGPTSGTIRLLRSLAPTKITKENENNGEAITALCQSMIGMPFLITTRPNKSEDPTKDGKFNNFISGGPCPEGLGIPAAALAPNAPSVDAPPPFDDDDIPF
jgi:hypothetical protein